MRRKTRAEYAFDAYALNAILGQAVAEVEGYGKVPLPDGVEGEIMFFTDYGSVCLSEILDAWKLVRSGEHAMLANSPIC